MPFLRGRTALSHLCVCAVLLAAATGVHAAKPVATDDKALTLDQTVQSLKDEALQFNRDALFAEEQFLYPPQSRLSVYVSNSTKNLLLTEITVTIDADEAVTYRYGEIDSRALLAEGSLQRVILRNVDRGAHRIRVSFAGQYADAKSDANPVVGNYEAVFDKGLDPAELELQIQRSGRRIGPGIKLTEWRAAEE